MDWLNECEEKDVHITHYEFLSKSPVEEIRKILIFLGLPVDEDRLECIKESSDGLFKRKPSKHVPLDMNPYNAELKNIIYEAIDELNLVLEKKGKPRLPISLYEMYDELEAKISRKQRTNS